jgi:hypothetical protein
MLAKAIILILLKIALKLAEFMGLISIAKDWDHYLAKISSVEG